MYLGALKRFSSGLINLFYNFISFCSDQELPGLTAIYDMLIQVGCVITVFAVVTWLL